MTQVADLLDPEILFSRENPFLKSAGKTHRRIFEFFDNTVRLHLSFAEDLLNMNRKRFESLYAGGSLLEMVSAHQDLATEIGKRTAVWAGDLQEVALDLQGGIGHVAIELVSPEKEK
jgi:hypothetical protein